MFVPEATGSRTLVQRFEKRQYCFRDDTECSIDDTLRDFLSSVFTGEQSDSLWYLYKFGFFPALGVVRWPMRSIQLEYELFPSGRALQLKELMEQALISCVSGVSGTAQAWVLVVQVAILLQCLYARVSGGEGPFGIIAPGEQVVGVESVQLPSTLTTTAEATAQLSSIMQSRPVGTLLAATVSSTVLSSGSGGAVSFKTSSTSVRQIAYQPKIGTAPHSDEVAGLVESGQLLICHIATTAAGTTDNAAAGGSYGRADPCRLYWQDYSVEQIDSLLGESLRHLKPVYCSIATTTATTTTTAVTVLL